MGPASVSVVYTSSWLPTLSRFCIPHELRDPSQRSHWTDKPSLLKQCCYVWKANLGRKMSCEILRGLFPFMARLGCIRLFLLLQAYKKQQHSEEMTAFFKCQKKHPSERNGTYKCFFPCGKGTLLIFTCSFSWENQCGFLSQLWFPETLRNLLFNKEALFQYCNSFKTLWRPNPFVSHRAIAESEKILTDTRASASPLPHYFLLRQSSLSTTTFPLYKLTGGRSFKEFEIEVFI